MKKAPIAQRQSVAEQDTSVPLVPGFERSSATAGIHALPLTVAIHYISPLSGYTMKNSALHLALIVLLAPWLSSCATTVLPRQAAFDDAEFAHYRRPGSGSVSGQLVVTSGNGSTQIGVNNHVALFPVTAYSKEIVEREVGNGEYLQASDPRFLQYARTTTTDATGNFGFNHLAPGEYFVLGLAQWNEGNTAQYQWACETIRVGGGQTAGIKLTHDLHHPQRPTLVVWPLW